MQKKNWELLSLQWLSILACHTPLGKFSLNSLSSASLTSYSIILWLLLFSCKGMSYSFTTPWTVACQAPLSVGILQTRILEWVAMPSSRVSSQSRDWIQLSHGTGGFFKSEPPEKPKNTGVDSLALLQGSSWPWNQTRVSCIAGRFFTSWATREAQDYYSTIKKNEILPLARTWMDLEGIVLSEISQTEKDTVWYDLHVESKKYNTQVNKTRK